MTKRWIRVLLSVLALAVLLVVGLGFVYMVIPQKDAFGNMGWRHETWIPLLILALGAAGSLYGMDAVRALKRENPLNLLPAAALGISLCVATGTPILWVRYQPKEWQIPYAALFVLAVLLIECLRLALDGQARKMRWDGRSAAKTAGLMLLCCVPAGIAALMLVFPSVRPIWFRWAVALLSGAAALWIVRRGNRAAGFALLATGAAGMIAVNLMMRLNAAEMTESVGFLAARIIIGLADPESLSAYAFCTFAGAKCLLPEKKS